MTAVATMSYTALKQTHAMYTQKTVVSFKQTRKKIYTIINFTRLSVSQ